MVLNFAFLANSAEIMPDGRFFVLGGGIDGFTASDVPEILPAISIIASIYFSAEECDRDYEFRAELQLPDGSDPGTAASTVLAPRIPVETPGVGPNLKVSVSLFGLVLPQHGRYCFNFFVGTHPIGQAYFHVSSPSTHADHRILPIAFRGATMCGSDNPLSLPAAQHDVPLPSTAPASDLASDKQESVSVPVELDAELERTRRQLLERRMPPRAGIKAIIDRRRGQPDPWLDDKYDWEPKD